MLRHQKKRKIEWAISGPKSKPKTVKSGALSDAIFGRFPLLLPDLGVDDYGRLQKRLGLLNREGMALGLILSDSRQILTFLDRVGVCFGGLKRKFMSAKQEDVL